MTAKEKNKISFIDQILYSVQPEKYRELVTQPAKAAAGFLIILCLWLTIMDYVVPAAGWIASFGGFDHLITKVLPEIVLSDGELSVADRIEIGKGETVHLLVDTSQEKVTKENLNQQKYQAEFLIARDNMVLYNSYIGAMEIDFAQFGNSTLNNETLLQVKPWIYAMLIINFFTVFIAELIRYLFAALPMAVLGWIMGGPERTNRLSFSSIFFLALYAKAAAALVLSFNSTAGLLSSEVLLVYAGLFFTVFLLMNGIRKIEEKK